MSILDETVWFTKVDSEDMCMHCNEMKVTYCLQVDAISLNLCTSCGVTARETIVDGLMNKIRGCCQ